MLFLFAVVFADFAFFFLVTIVDVAVAVVVAEGDFVVTGVVDVDDVDAAVAEDIDEVDIEDFVFFGICNGISELYLTDRIAAVQFGCFSQRPLRVNCTN